MSFDWRATLVLVDDVEIVELNAFGWTVRAEVADTGEEYMIHRPGSRESAKAIDADGARLLESFRKPRRIVDAVVAMSRSLGIPAEQLLEDCFPLLRRMVAAGLLAVAGSEAAARLAPSLSAGQTLGRWAIEACVRLIDDSEVYRARSGEQLAAIKRLRPRGVENGLAPLVAREADVLGRLDGSVTPALLGSNLADELPWLAITWKEGRRPDKLGADHDMVAVSLAIAEAYAALHRQGILHGDVHPGNILVAADGSPCLLDFALARVPGDRTLDHVFRGAVQGYWEPEFAAAMLRGDGEIPLTAVGEQYAVATLIDTLLVGEPAVRLPAVASRHWQAIAEGDHRCFAERGREPWPAVERVLRRATAREPPRRHADMAEFATELRMAVTHAPAAIKSGTDPLRLLLDEVLPGGALFDKGLVTPPRASFNFGAAGIAFALYRAARARDDGELLAAAELWQERAEAALESTEAFYDVGEFRAQDLGQVSPYHTTSGVWLTRALIGRALGDFAACDVAVRRFAAAASAETDELDLTLGRSSALLGAAILYGVRPAPVLRRLGDQLTGSIGRALQARPPIRDGRAIGYLGIAHGWAGYLYAALMWARATATSVAPSMVERLAQLVEIGAGDGAQLRVPVVVPDHDVGSTMVQTMDGWCHGQAGHVFLRLLASQVLRGSAGFGDRLMDDALRLGETAFAGQEDAGNLCCGLAGRAYAMLALYRATEDRKWLGRARSLAMRATAGTVCDRWPNSLYKGRVGLAVITAEVERPELAAMPLFEDEGWL